MDGFPNIAHTITSWHGMHQPGSGSPRTLKEMASRVKNILKQQQQQQHLELILSQIKQPTPMT